MSKKKIGVGIVGVTPGRSWATMSHIPALRGLPEYDVVGVANSNLSSSQAAAGAYDIPKAFPDAGTMAADPAVDLVAITVKVPHHAALVKAALDAGKMVYCEWPLGNGLAEAEAMAAQAAAAGIRTVVGLQARSSPVIRYVHDLIRDGYVGEVLSTTLVGSGMSWGPFANAPHAYTHDRANGATMLTIPFGHTIDALCYCLGEFRELSATLAMRRSEYTVVETQERHPMAADDQIVVNGVLQSGAVVAAHYRGGVSRGTNLRWEINGTEGDLEITSIAGHAQMFELTLRGATGADTSLQELKIPEKYRTIPAEIDAFAVNVGEVYHQFAEDAAAVYPVQDFAAAVQRHRLLDAILKAAETGKRVTL